MNQSSETTNQPDEEKPPLLQRLKNLIRPTPKTTEDMVAIVEAASENEVIDEDAKRIIAGALEVSEMHVRDIMIPRTQMVVLKAEDSLENNLQTIIDSAHSRYPVVGENIDEILGVLLAKDLLPLLFKNSLLAQQVETSSKIDNNLINDKNFILDLIRPTVFVPDSKRLNILLKQFREDRNHMALVINEYGTLAGLVTIEDVLEEIVGEIEDEHDVEDKHIRKLSQLNYIVNALTPIAKFNEYFDARFPDEDFSTIGGIVINKFGHLPQRNEYTSIDGFTFHVTRADNRRLHSLRMSVKSVDSTPDHSSDED